MGKVAMGARDLATKHSTEELQEAIKLQHEQAKAELERVREKLKKTSPNPVAGRPLGRKTQRCACGKHTAKRAREQKLRCAK